MSACPFCRTEMQGAFSQGLLRDVCEQCGAQWIEGEMLEKVVGHAATDTLLREAKGLPGQCKGCQESLQYVPSCPRCGRDAPTCPQCHAAPLPASEVSGVQVDVCTRCRGIALDASGLERLQEAVKRERFLELELRPQVPLAPDGTPAALACATCARKLRPQHAFTWDRLFYCGSCAPSEAAPNHAELTRAGYSADFTSRNGGLAQGMAEGPIAGGLTWLFSKLFR